MKRRWRLEAVQPWRPWICVRRRFWTRRGAMLAVAALNSRGWQTSLHYHRG